MKTVRYVCIVCAVCVLSVTVSFAADPLPDYILKAQSLVGQANSKSAGLNDFADAVLVGQNYLRSAETEYKKNLSWGKVELKAEPTVRYYADMARIQASIVLSQVGKIEQEKELLRLDGLSNEVKAKLKVFDDKTAAISAMKAELSKRDATIADLKSSSAELKKQIDVKQSEIGRLSATITSLTSDLSLKATALAAAEEKNVKGSEELKVKQLAIIVLEQKVAEAAKNLDASRAETARLRGEMATLAAQKGAAESQSQEQIQSLKRSQEFVTEVGKLGGVIKTGSDNMTVIFVRSAIIKAPKNDSLTAEGDTIVGRVTALLKSYPEFRVKLKVHGFGQPAKNEDASATDRIARLIREALVEKGSLDPATVEALGAGSSEPIYQKGNAEGNKRVEITFIKK